METQVFLSKIDKPFWSGSVLRMIYPCLITSNGINKHMYITEDIISALPERKPSMYKIGDRSYVFGIKPLDFNAWLIEIGADPIDFDAIV